MKYIQLVALIFVSLINSLHADCVSDYFEKAKPLWKKHCHHYYGAGSFHRSCTPPITIWQAMGLAEWIRDPELSATLISDAHRAEGVVLDKLLARLHALGIKDKDDVVIEALKNPQVCYSLSENRRLKNFALLEKEIFELAAGLGSFDPDRDSVRSDFPRTGRQVHRFLGELSHSKVKRLDH